MLFLNSGAAMSSRGTRAKGAGGGVEAVVERSKRGEDGTEEGKGSSRSIMFVSPYKRSVVMSTSDWLCFFHVF